jgi:hypothetical protein
LIASLKPLREVDTEQKYTIKSYTHTPQMLKYTLGWPTWLSLQEDHLNWQAESNNYLLNLWLKVLSTAGCLPKPYTTSPLVSWAICLTWRRALKETR